MRIWMLFLMLAVASGCSMFGTQEQAPREDLAALQREQKQIREDLANLEKRLTKLNIAMENGLQTVIGNRGNIALIYNLLQEMLRAITSERSLQMDRLRSVLQVTERMAKHYGKDGTGGTDGAGEVSEAPSQNGEMPEFRSQKGE